jgi:uncharacterized protein YdhG (YjbR/CyaY superfamily)
MASQTTKRPARMSTRAKTVGEYLAAAPTDQRAALGMLRRTIKAAAPKASEVISYGMAGFKYKGKPVVYFSYWKDHCALYGPGTGTIKFTADKPLSGRRVTSLVKTRIAAIDKAG